MHILNDYYLGLGLEGSEYIPLFIVGGENEIPMPRVENPTYAMRPSGREFVCSDMMYCYVWRDTEDIDLQTFVDSAPRFAVGRLPLSEEHNMSDLQGYLDDCITFFSEGLDVQGTAITTAEVWMTASRDMVQDLPMASLSAERVPLNNRMVVCPPLDTELSDMYEDYVQELQKVDFLVSNLHGGDTPGSPSFNGQAKNDSRIKPQAIHPSMFRSACPLVFNTVACHGARYTGYAIEDSMLYSAFRSGAMLYCGASDNAIGAGGDEEYGSCSEMRMKLYNVYLYKGIPAGLALMKAKEDYLRNCMKEDGPDCAMYTVLEFNLFGCPLLRLQPKLDAGYQPTLYGHPIVQMGKVNYRPVKSIPVEENAFNTNDLHAYLRRRVDENLFYIRQKVEREVYQRLGLGAENIQQVLQVTQDDHEIGYRFIYMFTPHLTYRYLETYYLVNTNTKGDITKIMQTK